MDRKRKVIHVIGGGEFGGAEQHIIQLLTLFQQERIEAKVVCFYEAGFSRTLRNRGIPVEVLQYGRFDFRLLSGLRRLFQKEKPDVIHTHGVKANFFSRLAARPLDIPLITTVHSLLKFDYTNSLAYRFAAFMERSTRRWNHHFIAVSHAIKESLTEEGVAASEVTVVHHGMDTDKFRAGPSALREELGLSGRHYVIGVVGRLVRIKGVDYVLRAMPELIRLNPDVRLLVIGSGPEEDALKELAAQLGIAEQVRFLGFRSDIPDCMRALDCFVSGSLSEGLGLNVLEAMATEVPVVVTGVGGIRDFTHDGQNGIIVESRSSKQLAEGLLRLMTDRTYGETLAAAARKLVENGFSLASMSARTIEIYDDVAESYTGKEKTVVLSGYYGYGNSGDEALLLSILEDLKKETSKSRMGLRPVVLSIDPSATEQMHGVQATHRMRLLEIVRHIRHSSGLISGGGSLLQDMTGRMTIPYYLGIIKIAQWFGKPTFIYAQGVGPIKNKWFYPLIRYVYNKCDYISVRDAESKKFLEEIGVRQHRLEVVSDPVMGFRSGGPLVPDSGTGMGALRVGGGDSARPYCGDNVPPESSSSASGRPVIGVSVRFWHPQRLDLQRLTQSLRMILDETDAVLRFLPFQLPADLHASEYVVRELGAPYADRISVVTDAVRPQDMLEEVRNCDLVIGVRLHSLIYAANQYVPMVGIAYDPKIDQFLQQLEMKAVSNTDNLDPQAIAGQALELWRNKADWIRDKQGMIEKMKKNACHPAQQIANILRTKG